MAKFEMQEKSWDEIQKYLRAWKEQSATVECSAAHSFKFTTFPELGKTRLYALGPPRRKEKDHTLLYVDLPAEPLRDSSDGVEGSPKDLYWKPLLEPAARSDSKGSASPVKTLDSAQSKRLELLRERQRVCTVGLTAFKFHEASRSILFASGASLYWAKDPGNAPAVPYYALYEGTEVDDGGPVEFIDPQFCPYDPQLVAFVSQDDIFLLKCATPDSTNQNKLPQAVARKLTHVKERKDGQFIAGTPTFVIQEEFDRFRGVWWAPKPLQIRPNGPYCQMILFEETDETPVPEIAIAVSSCKSSRAGLTARLRAATLSMHKILCSATSPPTVVLVSVDPYCKAEGVDKMKYPRVGEPNARITLKMLLFNGQDLESNVEVLELKQPLEALFPWAEYVVRAGWVPDASGVWAQLVSRRQEHLALVFIPLGFFGGKSLSWNKDAEVVTLLEELLPHAYVPVHDHLYFLASTPPGTLEFLWSTTSPKGFPVLQFRQVDLLKRDSSGELLPGIIRDLTPSDSGVPHKSPWLVDEHKGLVYFVSYFESFVEPHIYVTSFRGDSASDAAQLSMTRVTPLGMSHWKRRQMSRLAVSQEGFLAHVGASLSSPPKCFVTPTNGTHLANPKFEIKVLFEESPSQPADEPMFLEGFEPSNNKPPLTPKLPVPENPQILEFINSKTGFTHYAMLCKPLDHKPGVQYPTLLYVYGGPEIQLVQNDWMGKSGFEKWTSLGYAVVMIDGRGSYSRGLAFEAEIRYKMGTIEIDDQIDGLKAIAELTGLIDLERVAIRGWSYGGYASLMALAQYPQLIRCAVAGAPVTDYTLYDTGYTERYMGLLQSHVMEYHRSSVVNKVPQFPNEANRLLIIHGLIDENVHFSHTAKLTDALMKAGKPFECVVLPWERHFVRNSALSEFLETKTLWFVHRALCSVKSVASPKHKTQ